MSVETPFTDDDGNGWSLPPQRSLPEIVERRITQAIHSGELKPGDRIVELHLAKKLGVSRTVLREALRTLEAKFVVVSKHGRGTYVTPMETTQIVQATILRATLEGTAARLIAGQLTPEILSNLKGQIREMERAALTGQTAEWREMDWRFHESVCVLSDNPFLLAAWRSISNLVKLYLNSHQDYDRSKSRVLTSHTVLLDALATGDPDRAEFAFKRSILSGAFARFGLDMPKSFASFVD